MVYAQSNTDVGGQRMIGRPLRIHWRDNDTPETLKEAYQSQTDINVRTRVHLLWLVRGGWQITAAAEAVGVHYRSAQRWIEWYREGGLDEVVSRKMGGVGQRRFLSDDQERGLVEEVGTGRFSCRWRDNGLGGVRVRSEVQGKQHIQRT